MAGDIKFSKTQIWSIVFLVAIVGLFVGLMTGLTPECVPPEDTSAARRSLHNAREVGERNKRHTNPWDEVRLPEGIQPTYYTMTFQPDLTGSDIFYGWVDIEVIVTEETEYPRVHAKNINISMAQILDSNGQEVAQVNEPFYYGYNEFFIMDVGGPLSVGTYTFRFNYTGELGGKIVGFYKSSYQVPGEDSPRYLATTDFQPTDARQAFPSFDEPNIKCLFKIRLIHEDKYIGISNMPEVNRVPLGNGMVETEFGDPEIKMSTYLVCFIVCDFKYVEGFTDRNIPFRVYAPEYQIDQANYSLEVGINITNYFEEYFGIPYSLSKLDMIAIPDFNSGAMENWGIITYRERYLLYDEAESSASDKQRICAVVAHELAHQWFGNLVTMDWWDDLWLNEGFASYVEYIGANHAEPSWQMLNQFVVIDMYYVFGLDQIVSSHPIIVDVNRPEEITEVFDSIPYSKVSLSSKCNPDDEDSIGYTRGNILKPQTYKNGASVLRMLNDFLGEDSFRQGLNAYLTEFAEGNAKSADLWAKLQEAYNNNGGDPDVVNVADIMDTWTKQMGFPVVNVERNGNDLRLNQDWFLVDPNANRSAAPYDSPYGYKWNIPFSSKFQSKIDGPPVYTWMYKEETDVSVSGDTSDWYIANYEEKGFYRVNYEEDNWNALSLQLMTGFMDVPIADRSGLIDDAFNLARAEQLTYDVALDLTLYLNDENQYVPWDAAYDNLMWLSDMLRFQPAYGNWRRYIAKQTEKMLAKYNNWSDNLSHLETFLRTDIIYLSCSSGDPNCLSEAFTQFNNYLSGEYVSPNVRSPVLRFGMEQEGGQENWDTLWQMYQDSVLSSEKQRILFGMARTRHVWLLARYLEYALDENKIRSQDFFTVLTYIADNPVGNALVWDFTRANWEYMVERFGLDSRSLGRLVPSITEFYSTELKLQQMEEFFAKYPEGGAGTRGRQQALERVRTNIQWVKRNQVVIEEWLKNNV